MKMQNIINKIKIKNVLGLSILALLFCMIYNMQEIPKWLGLKNFYRYEINQVAYDFRVEEPKTIARFSDLGKHYVYLFFGFTHCSSICPKMMGTLQNLAERLKEKELLFVFASIDPIRDTKEKLMTYAKAYGSKFIALKLHENEIEETLRQYKSYIYDADLEKLKTESNYQINHTGFLYLIDKQGKLKYLYASRDLKVEDLENDFREIVGEEQNL